MKQTAVEWLFNDYINKGIITIEAIEQAKEMEKKQIINSFVECWKANVPIGFECNLYAEQYYKENFKSE